MSVYFNNLISKTSIEKEWMRDVVDFITGLSNRITCSNDVDDEYDSSKWDDGTSHVPSFTFSIDDIPMLTYTRESNLATNSLAFTTKSPLDPTYVSTQQYFSTSWNQGAINQVIPRELGVSAIISNNLIMIALGGTSSYYRGYVMIYCTGSSNNYFGRFIGSETYSTSQIFNLASNAVFKEIDDGELVGSNGSFLSRFSYAAPAGQIDYIKSSIYQNNNSKVFEITSLYDSTTVTVGDTVSLKDGAYLAVGTHQLVKV